MGVFPNVTQAMNAVFKSLASGANPVAMEFLDALVIKALKEKISKHFTSFRCRWDFSG